MLLSFAGARLQAAPHRFPFVIVIVRKREPRQRGEHDEGPAFRRSVHNRVGPMRIFARTTSHTGET